MASYSYSDLESLWIAAGGDKAIAPTMAAIALAESGGNPASNNYTDNGGTQTSWGLWQVSNGTHNMPVANINDPVVNAQQAVAKLKSQGLTAWGTYVTGAYLKYVGRDWFGSTITDTNGGKPISEPTGGITNTPGAGATCTPPSVPFGLNPADWLTGKSTGNPGPTIAYYVCVAAVDVQRALWVVLGLVIVGFGLWVYSQDKDAPGGTQLRKIDQIPAKAAEVGAAIGG